MEPQLRVLIVDDRPLMRAAIALALEWDTRLGVAMAADLDSALDVLAAEPIDLVLLDATLPGSRLGDAVAALRRHAPRARIVVFSAGMAEGAEGAEVAAAGADARLSKTIAPADLAPALVSVARPGSG